MEKEIREFLREYWELAQDSMRVMTDEDMAEVVLRASVVADKIVDTINTD